MKCECEYESDGAPCSRCGKTAQETIDGEATSRKSDSKIELVGPFVEEYHRPTINGYEIPNLRILRRKGANDGIATVLLDNRFSIDVPDDQLDPWLWIVANAMAIGAGYSCHGENSTKEWNPFKRKLIGLSELPEN